MPQTASDAANYGEMASAAVVGGISTELKRNPLVKLAGVVPGVGDAIGAATSSMDKDVAGAKSRIAGRDAAKAASQTAFANQTRAAGRAPIQTDDVIANWLRMKGKDEAGLKKDKQLQADFTKAFGQDVVAGGVYGRQNDITTVAAKDILAETGRQALPVEIVWTSENPGHKIMAI